MPSWGALPRSPSSVGLSFSYLYDRDSDANLREDYMPGSLNTLKGRGAQGAEAPDVAMGEHQNLPVPCRMPLSQRLVGESQTLSKQVETSQQGLAPSASYLWGDPRASGLGAPICEMRGGTLCTPQA